MIYCRDTQPNKNNILFRACYLHETWLAWVPLNSANKVSAIFKHGFMPTDQICHTLLSHSSWFFLPETYNDLHKYCHFKTFYLPISVSINFTENIISCIFISAIQDNETYDFVSKLFNLFNNILSQSRRIFFIIFLNHVFEVLGLNLVNV